MKLFKVTYTTYKFAYKLTIKSDNLQLQDISFALE